MSFPYVLGRLVFGGFFLYNGINHFKNRQALEGYAASKGLPNPELAILGSAALLTASGASLTFGLKPGLGALGVVTFLALVSPTMHDFWNQQDAGQKQNDTIHFSKNMALLGAALALMGAGHKHCHE
ncbi:MAG: DoxX family protein [Acidobacteriaceae bacterium]